MMLRIHLYFDPDVASFKLASLADTNIHVNMYIYLSYIAEALPSESLFKHFISDTYMYIQHVNYLLDVWMCDLFQQVFLASI